MLFCFSATGNTHKLAKIITDRISEKLINIEDALKRQEFDYQLEDGERLGFAFPIFFGSVPEIVLQFVEKLNIKTADHYYGYIVVTDGGMSEFAPSMLARMLLKRAITINGVFGLKTVDTFPLYSNTWEEKWDEDYINKIDLQSKFIAEQIVDRTKGEYDQKSPFPRMMTFFMKPLYIIFNKTSGFKVSDKCTSCGLCAEKCPMNAIEIQDGHPIWVKTKCMICMRCLHHCPAAAIDFGNWTQNKPRYKKPI